MKHLSWTDNESQSLSRSSLNNQSGWRVTALTVLYMSNGPTSSEISLKPQIRLLPLFLFFKSSSHLRNQVRVQSFWKKTEIWFQDWWWGFQRHIGGACFSWDTKGHWKPSFYLCSWKYVSNADNTGLCFGKSQPWYPSLDDFLLSEWLQ